MRPRTKARPGRRATTRSLRDAAAALLRDTSPDDSTTPPQRDDSASPAGIPDRQRHALAVARGAGSSDRRHLPVSAAAAPDATAATAVTATATATGDSSGSDDEESEGSSSSDDSRYSTECTACDRHISRGDGGNSCEVLGCRATRCRVCMPSAEPYLCRQHGDVVGVTAAAAAATAAAGPAAGSVVPAAVSEGTARATVAAATRPATTAVLVRALPEALTQAASMGIDAAIATLGEWRQDPDMIDLVDDLTACLEWGPSSTKVRGTSALRRLDECCEVLPVPLRQSVATPDICDVVLSAFVSGRLRVNVSGKRIPDAWNGRPIPEPPTVRSEVTAIVGLLRTARILPADPRGTLPALRNVMRKTGCSSRNGASPRGYTFLWELVEAWRSGIVPRNDPQAVGACGLFVTGIHFLLRTKYVREVEPDEIAYSGADTRYQLTWKWADKTRTALMTAAGAAAAARASTA